MVVRKRAVRIFLDSSVIFAAVISSSGGSFRLLTESKTRNLKLYVTRYVIEEVDRALVVKYQEMQSTFQYYLRNLPFLIIKNPSAHLVLKYINIVSQEDAPIIAASLKSRADYLLTFDRKHFLNNKTLAKIKLPFSIMTPGDFIQKHFL